MGTASAAGGAGGAGAAGAAGAKEPGVKVLDEGLKEKPVALGLKLNPPDGL